MKKNLSKGAKNQLKEAGNSFKDRPSFMDRVKSALGSGDEAEDKKKKKKKKGPRGHNTKKGKKFMDGFKSAGVFIGNPTDSDDKIS